MVYAYMFYLMEEENMHLIAAMAKAKAFHSLGIPKKTSD